MDHTSPTGSQKAGNVRTILIVEDNFDNRLIYSTYLEHAGFHVLQAEDGLAGVELALAERPDLILMDISLPVMDGLEAIRRLRADAALRDTPIVAITAHAMTRDRESAIEAGATSYLAKPVDPRAVYAEVSSILGAS